MRFAYITSHLPRRRELGTGPIDAEWIVESDFDVTVFVDYSSDGTDLLAEAGVPVEISPKRSALFADARLETAEELQARRLLDLHLDRPFDALLYASDRATDWAWHQPRLGPIPRGIAVGPGAIRDARLVTADPALFHALGRELWATTGPIAGADFLVSDVGVAEYGLDPDGLPPVYSVNDLPSTPAGPGAGTLAAIVAFSESPAGLATIVSRALEQTETTDDTVLAVIHPDVATPVESTRDIIRSGVPADVLGRIRFAEPSSDGIAEGLLVQADTIVAARGSDLAVRAVADIAGKVGAVVLSGSASPIAPLVEIPGKVVHPPARLVPVDGPLADLVPLIDELAGEAPGVILHSRQADRTAQRVWRMAGSVASGLTLVCDAGPYLGDPDPARPAFNLLGFDMATWPSIRRLISHVDTLHQLVESAASLVHAGRVNLTALPVAGAGHGRLGPRTPPLPGWLTDGGMLPAPNLAGLSEAEFTRPESPVAQSEPGTVKHWAETHGFGDRVRLALPWKWGLLNRAMKNRW
ncbi:MAG: hypothetical protein HKN74_14385 [Acidimicrobiia bacterium]|nr:hypothetical protein [Acidimicrobiia bacterium]NNF11462.1 hypothetical protein [Acidimicrobiia bacterium]